MTVKNLWLVSVDDGADNFQFIVVADNYDTAIAMGVDAYHDHTGNDASDLQMGATCIDDELNEKGSLLVF